MSSADTADETGQPDQTEAPPREPGRFRRFVERYRARLSFTGMVVAVALAALSLTPSLLPRGPLFQGIVTGGAAALGYGVGVFLSWLARFMMSRTQPWPRPPRSWWIALGVVDLLALAGMTIGFALWQRDLRGLMNVEQLPPSAYPLMFLLSLLFFALFMAIGQGWGGMVRALSRRLSRWVPRRISAVVVGALAVVLTLVVVDGVVVTRIMDQVRSTFANINDDYNPAEKPPESAVRSGGTNSSVSWPDLGLYGRQFVTAAPKVDDLTAFNGTPAMEPVRAYAGLRSVGDSESADGIEDAAELAADELERMGGLQRKVVGIATSTGRGWVNQVTAGALDYMYNGDSAMVSMQYSTLPSAISFLVDQQRARSAGMALFEAVDRRAKALPPETRPKVVIFGESLGTFGGEAAFGSIGSMVARTDGALFAGPTFANTIWTDLTKNRDAGSPEWLPIYRNGESVRFISKAEELNRPDAPWNPARVVYVQHSSDPIGWFSPRLLIRKPDWLKDGQRGPDILPQMRWIPIVTFLQVAADLATAGDVTDGHGHVYIRAIPPAWAKVLEPEGWNDEKTARLTDVLVETGTDG